MYEIRKIDVRSAIKIGAIVVFALALVCPPVVTLIIGFLKEFVFSSRPDPFDVFEYLLDDDFWAFYVPFVPIATIGGFLVGAATSFVYNLICERIGGLKLDIYLTDEAPLDIQSAADKTVGKEQQ